MSDNAREISSLGSTWCREWEKIGQNSGFLTLMKVGMVSAYYIFEDSNFSTFWLSEKSRPLPCFVNVQVIHA